MDLRPWDSSIPKWAIRLSFFVLLLWIAASCVFVQTASAFLSVGGVHMGPPEHTRSIVSLKEIGKYYQGLLKPKAYYYITGNNLRNSTDLELFEEYAKVQLKEEFGSAMGGLYVYGYYAKDKEVYPYLSSEWTVFKNDSATVFLVYTVKNDRDYARNMTDFMRNLTTSSPMSVDHGLTFQVGGDYQMDVDCDGKEGEALRVMESIVIPVAFAVLAFYLRRVQLLLVPLCCILGSIGLTFSLSYPVALKYPVSSTTPEILMSLIAALSIDYSLFLFTRLLEDQELGLPLWEGVKNMIVHTGYTIVVSSILISFAFAASFLVPIPVIQTAGALSALAAVSTAFANLTIAPTLVVCFGRVIMAPAPKVLTPTYWYNRIKSGCTTTEETPFSLVELEDEAGEEEAKESLWYRLAHFTRRHSTTVLVACFLASLPILYFLPQLKTSIDRNLTRPRGAGALDLVRQLESEGFNMGKLDPSVVMVWSVDSSSTVTPSAVSALTDLGENIYDAMGNETGTLKHDTLCSPVHYDGQVLSYQEALSLAFPTDDVGMSRTDIRERYKILLGAFTSGDSRNRTLMQVFPPFRSFGPKGGPFMRRFREKIDEFNVKYEGKFAAVEWGSVGHDVDTADLLNSRMPLAACVVCISVAVAVAVAFRSIVLPLRLACALAYTVAVTLGCAVIVYQTKAFWWLFPYLSNFENEGLAYTVPMFVLPVCIALGLDYDIFLLTRILEYRKSGMSDEDSIVRGVAATGSTISGAGVIMSIAFCGLLASPNTQLNQFAFLLTLSVLLDTFVIRTIVVPAMMFKAATYNWWPRQLPPVKEVPVDISLSTLEDIKDPVDVSLSVSPEDDRGTPVIV